MSRFTEIKLVAGRELRAQLFKKATIFSTLFMIVLVVGGIVFASFMMSGDNDQLRVGIDNPSAMPGISQVKSGDGDGVSVQPMGRAEAEKQLRGDDPQIDVFVDTSKSPVEIVSWNGSPRSFTAAVSALSSNAALAAEVQKLGGNPSQVMSAVSDSTPRVIELKSDQGQVDPTKVVMSFSMAILLFFLVVGSGGQVAMSVVEEKTSRVVEILLSTIRPSSLLAGKVLGAGASSLISTAAIAIPGLITAWATGMLKNTNLNIGWSLLWLVVWVLIGFATFSLLYATAGSMVSRMEDMGQLTMPIMLIVMVPYIIAVSVLPNDPTSTLARVLSYIPFFAPFLAPSRSALGVATTTDTAVSLVLSILVIPLIVFVASRLYKGAILHTGGRVKLRQAWKRQ